MNPARTGRPKPCRWREKTLVALLTASAALTAGAALIPAPATAMMNMGGECGGFEDPSGCYGAGGGGSGPDSGPVWPVGPGGGIDSPGSGSGSGSGSGQPLWEPPDGWESSDLEESLAAEEVLGSDSDDDPVRAAAEVLRTDEPYWDSQPVSDSPTSEDFERALQVCNGVLTVEANLRDQIEDGGSNATIRRKLRRNRTTWKRFQCENVMVGPD